MVAMTLDERLEAIARNLDTLTQIHVDNDREYRERFQKLTEALEENVRDIRDLTQEMKGLKSLLQQDAENIRALARIAEIHEQLDGFEGR
jgi:HSCB C-terminal oligomerisation domain